MRNKSEIRNPKSETNSKKEEMEKSKQSASPVCLFSLFGFSGLFRISDFGFRISHGGGAC